MQDAVLRAFTVSLLKRAVCAGSAMRQVERKGWAVCECCGLLAPKSELLPWQQRVLCRSLATLEPLSSAAGRTGEAWASGPFRCYWVLHEHQVCWACFDYLLGRGILSSTHYVDMITLVTFGAAFLLLLSYILFKRLASKDVLQATVR